MEFVEAGQMITLAANAVGAYEVLGKIAAFNLIAGPLYYQLTKSNLPKDSTTMSGIRTPPRSPAKRKVSRTSRFRMRKRARPSKWTKGAIPPPSRRHTSGPSSKRSPGKYEVSGNDQPQGINTKMYLVPVASKRKHKTGGATWNYRINYHGILTSGIGAQSFNDMFLINTVAQMFTSSGNGYNVGQSYTALNLLNPYQKMTGSTLWATPIFSNDQFVIKYVNVYLDITNFGDSAVNLDIHLFKAATSHNDLPTTVVNNGLLVQGNNVAALGVPTLSAVDTQGSLAMTMPGVAPQEYKQLSKSWKTVGLKSVNLAAGASENLCFKILLNKKVEQQSLAEIAAYYNTSTMCFSAVQRGSLAKDTVNIDASYANTEIGWIANVQYVMTAVKDNANRINTSYGASQITNNTITQVTSSFVKTAPVIL